MKQVRGTVEEDITAYGEKRSHMGFDPSDPASTPDLVDYYGRALDAYETAKAKSAAARRPENVRAVSEALEEGRFTLACSTPDARASRFPSGVRHASSTRGTARRPSP
ncbi:hypothetical protein [Streptomyces sp. RTd22]|uniref:hypothetical protein n=1 Tax=Streptomyces sp. RTd22 TaxID=1841249 RepID=UPI0007C54863|nr:hypothetical protein [Streptomyces sp. RTd22]